MINTHMSKCQHYSPIKIIDEYGQDQYDYIPLRNIDIAIYLYTQKINTTNPIYLETTHIGLSKDKDIHIKDKIDNYEVLYTNPQGRLNQIFLKEVM